MEFNNDTLVASFAPFPFPAPSSFATRTPVAAKSPNGIMDSQPMIVTLTERASMATSVFFI
nr:hypothetical protein Iba_chr14aCG20650 [Ipomoea batatas]